MEMNWGIFEFLRLTLMTFLLINWPFFHPINIAFVCLFYFGCKSPCLVPGYKFSGELDSELALEGE